MINLNKQFYWQQWDNFNIKFWALYICLFSAFGYEKIKLKELLKGANYLNYLNLDVNIDIPHYNHICTHYFNNRYPSGDDHNMLTFSSYDINSKIIKTEEVQKVMDFVS
jgi:hypothetical protein